MARCPDRRPEEPRTVNVVTAHHGLDRVGKGDRSDVHRVVGEDLQGAETGRIVVAQRQLEQGQAQLDAAKAQAEAAGTLDQAAAGLTAKQAEIDQGKAQLDAERAKLDEGAALLEMSSGIRLVSEDGSAAVAPVMFKDTHSASRRNKQASRTPSRRPSRACG
jgi:hypothetical protein